MAEALAAPVEFGPEPKPMTLSTRLLHVLSAGEAVRLAELLSTEGLNGNHVSIDVNGAGASPATVTSPPPPVGTSRGTLCLLGLASNGNTALHIAASRGHAEVVALVCEKAPSLVATRNRSLDTPLHCAAKAGHQEIAACLLSKMRAGGEEEAAALLARNCLGATALYEAVRHRRLGVPKKPIFLLTREAPELSALTAEKGFSPLYLAASIDSLQMVRTILRPSSLGMPSPAAYSGPEGQTALHAAAMAKGGIAREMAQQILKWKPEGPSLLAKVNSLGRTPLHSAIWNQRLDVVDLFIDAPTSDELARISNNKGLFPVHFAAMVGSTTIVNKLAEKCPDYCEMVDDCGRNLLHYAVKYNQDNVVRHICQNAAFSGLLNAMDCDGNTPLHLAAARGFARIVSLLLQTMSVEIHLANKDGQTALDVAWKALPKSLTYDWSPSFVVLFSLDWSRAAITPSYEARSGERSKDGTKGPDEEASEAESFSKTGTIGSVLIATVAFAAAFTVPGGIVADDHPGAGTAVMARRFAFRAFVVSDTMAFLCSIVSTFFLIYSGTRGAGASHKQRVRYNRLAFILLPLSALFTMAAFPFGFQLVLGDANRRLIIFVYALSSASVLVCLPEIWFPLWIGLLKALWRRDGWRALVTIFLRSPMMSTEEVEAKRKAKEEDAKKAALDNGNGGSVTKSEMRNEMMSMLQELIGMGMLGFNTGASSSSLKLELMPNDVKLEGSKNYLSWARRVNVLLSAKGVENYLEEDCVEPENKLSTEWRVWHTTNSTVVAWLMASMSPSIAKMVESMRSAAKIWKTLSNMYSRKGNVMMMMEIQGKADTVKQEGRTVEEYASELKYLWGELDHYAPLQMETANDT
ncbi:hypothetical protein U9M48_015422 [Paspalum notatum var. saurae]|uniref:PGG domain-containing protein n=1 Tax=Paspalum notatum var. saurae TaxID=547442 RepID=A0AAQ3WM09_PASNO